MTTKAEWLALAERCEAAKGPHRDIDAAIALAVGWYHLTVAGPSGRFANEHVGFRPGTGSLDRLPDFTASLDAITALIERELPGCGWIIDRSPSDARIAGSPVAPQARIQQHGDEWTYEGWLACNAATPALALCAAFCRAMVEKAA